MASSVLGKRTRVSDLPGASTLRSSSRVKRRVQTAIYNDENDDPFVARASNRSVQDGDFMEVDELHDATLFKSPRKAVKEASTPVKHTVAGSRIALSPTKINTVFKASKPVVADEPEKSKIIQVATPQTPRRRDALSKRQPVTPRHRVTVASKLFTPKTPRTPTTPSSSIPTIYAGARQLFVRSSNPGPLVGRDEERKELCEFIESRIMSKSGGCIYVSGPPGTGKSALVTETVGNYVEGQSIKTAYVNCMSVKSSGDIFTKLKTDLCEDIDTSEGNEAAILQGLFISKKENAGVYIVTLDEIDHLLTLDLEILYTIFEWSMQRSSRLILLGIANALDLTDRFLPRLKARNLRPQLLPFLPYTAPQIASVITAKLKFLLPEDAENPTTAPEFVPFLHPTAILLCSKKVASQTGDLRKAFDLCRRAIDLIESETKEKLQRELNEDALQFSPSKTPLIDNMNLSSSPSSNSPTKTNKPSRQQALAVSLAKLTVRTAPRATIAHIARITSATFSNGAEQRLKALNLQQKAALCALLAREKRSRAAASSTFPTTPSKNGRNMGAAISIRTLFDTYTALCKQDGQLHPLTSTEFRDVIGSLETLSLVSIFDSASNGGTLSLMRTPSKRTKIGGFGNGGDERKVTSCVGSEDVEAAFEGAGSQILKAILRGEGLE